jgi:hypothetical protein
MIFYENKRAEELLKSGHVSHVCFDDVVILAKHFKRIGKNKSQVKKSLIDFYEKNNPDFNEVLAIKIINSAINTAQKFGMRFPIDVKITESEVRTIRSAGDYKTQKILFTMLVLAKYFKNNNTKLVENKIEDISDEEYDNNFYVNYKITDIVKIAKVNISKRERNNFAYEMQQKELIVGIGLKAYKICFVNDNSPIAIMVTDMNTLIDFYPWYCENCGKILERKAKRHSLCAECYGDKRRIVIKESVRKYRENSM